MDPLNSNPPDSLPQAPVPPDQPPVDLEAERSLNSSEALIRSLYKLWRFAASGDLANKLENAAQNECEQKEDPMPEPTSQPDDEPQNTTPEPPESPESPECQDGLEPPEALESPVSEETPAPPDAPPTPQPDTVEKIKTEDKNIIDAIDALEQDILTLADEDALDQAAGSVDELKQEVNQIIEAAASIDRVNAPDEDDTGTPISAPDSTMSEDQEFESISNDDLMEELNALMKSGGDKPATPENSQPAQAAPVELVSKPAMKKVEWDTAPVEESAFEAISDDDLMGELNALMSPQQDQASMSSEELAPEVESNENENENEQSVAQTEETPSEGVLDQAMIDAAMNEVIESPAAEENEAPITPADSATGEESAFESISNDDLMGDLNALMSPADDQVAAPADSPEPEKEVEPIAAENENAVEENTEEEPEAPTEEIPSDGVLDQAMIDAAMNEAAEPPVAEEEEPVIEAPPKPESTNEPVDLTGLDAILAENVGDLLQGDIKAVDEALDSIFKKEAVLAEIGEVEPEMGDPSMLVCDDNAEIDESTIDDQVASYKSKQLEREKSSGQPLTGPISDDGVAPAGNNFSSLEVLDEDADHAEEEATSSDHHAPDPAPPPNKSTESGAGDPAGEENQTKSKDGKHTELKPNALAVASMVKPALIGTLKGLNYPLRFLPESARTMVDFVALTLVFWVPIVWMLVLFVF